MILLAGCGRIAFDSRSDATSATDDGALRADGDVPSDLWLYVTFESDGFLVDRARGHTLTCRGACPTPAPGRVAAAAGAFGGTGCVEVAPADFDLTNLTVAVWANVPAPAGDAELVSVPLDVTTSMNAWEVFLEAATTNWTFGGGGNYLGTPATVNTWQHIAITLSNGTLAMYRDGALQQMFGPFTPTYGGQPLLLGCDRDNNVDVARLTGLLDDVRIYNRGLTAQEVAALANL